MAWKKDDNGNIVLVDGNPVLIGGDGSERAIADNFISDLNNEAATRRREVNELKGSLSKFDGIDIDEAKKALETTKNIDLSKMVGLDKLEEVRTDVAGQFKGQMDALTESLNGANDQIRQLLVSNAFASSQFVSENTVLLPDFAESYFGKHFKVENNQAVAYQGDQPILSMEKPGQLAGFDEALKILVNAHPNKDSILKGAGASGSGSQGSMGAASRKWSDYSPGQLVELARNDPPAYERLKQTRE